jgi:hypothetical protein
MPYLASPWKWPTKDAANRLENWQSLATDRYPFPYRDRHLAYAVHLSTVFNSPPNPLYLYSSPPPTSIDIHSHTQRLPLISQHFSTTYTLCSQPTRTVARASTPTPSRKCARSPPQPRRPRHLPPRPGLRHPRPSQTRLSRPQLILRTITLRRILGSTHHPQSPRPTPSRSSHPHL